MQLFNVLNKMVLTFESANEILTVTIHCDVTEHDFIKHKKNLKTFVEFDFFLFNLSLDLFYDRNDVRQRK